MKSTQPVIVAGLLSLSALTGCMSGDSGSSAGVNTPDSGSGSAATPSGSTTSPGGFTTPTTTAAGTKDSVVTTTSVPGTVAVIAGGSQTISITFASSDGRLITGLALTSTETPTNWSGTSNYGCTQVGAGNTCVLNLTYSPQAVEAGSFVIRYEYIDNANEPQNPGGTVTIPYMATPYDNVVATAAPTGQITAPVSSGSQTVNIAFTTDDGNAATGLTLTTDLTSLPSGWSSTSSSFSCDIVSFGNGCLLTLHYAPTTPGSGNLTLGYGYADNTGTARTGALNIPYTTTSAGTVVATVAPVGQVTAVEKTGQQAVRVSFNTTDGRSASNLRLLSPLSSLPAGWSSPASAFACGAVGTGNACQLTLSYAPPALASGTLSFDYGYVDADNTYNVGSFNVNYAATTNDNIVGTVAPSGEIDAVVGQASPTATITFATDDGRPATALEVKTNLASLPAGWLSASSSFQCAGVNGGTACELPLTFTPDSAGSGSLTLTYQYNNDAGVAKTGSVSIPYRATTDDSVVATADIAPLTVVAGSSTPVTLTFVSDDGNPQTALSVVSGLNPLPTSWSSGAGTFNCAAIAAGTSCQLVLTYAPLAAESGTLLLGYAYTNNAGLAKVGTISIPYTATP